MSFIEEYNLLRTVLVVKCIRHKITNATPLLKSSLDALITKNIAFFPKIDHLQN